ncbi:hypothetical protein ASZ90_017846 [hydrocarbon metagenome]|uniref:Uncharacterized protein n=1 Tax=hydrocarbon metagenome TaxID=938273 RepID=A0A0W8E8D7_9ZZZZ
MVFQFARDLSSELLDVDGLFKKSILPWWQEIETYRELIKLDHTWRALPAVVLSVYRGTGFNREFCISMANIFKILYLSVFIHELIKDDEEGQEYNQDMQFSILIGDYMFGRILALLIEAEADMLLPIFADMICEINEGMVKRYKLGSSEAEFVESRRASFYKTAFLTAAFCAGKNVEEQGCFREAGYKLGMALELLQEEGLREEALSFLEDSEKLLSPEQGSRISTSMGPIYKEMRSLLTASNKLAVV